MVRQGSEKVQSCKIFFFYSGSIPTCATHKPIVRWVVLAGGPCMVNRDVENLIYVWKNDTVKGRFLRWVIIFCCYLPHKIIPVSKWMSCARYHHSMPVASGTRFSRGVLRWNKRRGGSKAAGAPRAVGRWPKTSEKNN